MKMKFFLGTTLLVAVPASSLGLSAAVAESPVEKVVKLLQDLQTRLTADGTTEQAAYDKYACWCETTTDRKAQAIEAAKNDLRSLGQDILTNKGKVASLSAEIVQTTTNIKDNEASQLQATSIRSKENAAYTAEAAEMKQAISALEQAIHILGAATGKGAALLQRGAAAAAATRAAQALEHAIRGAPEASLARLAKNGQDAPTRLALLRNYVTDLSTGKAKYQPQSDMIQGILHDMYSSFAVNQQSADSAEADANTHFEALIATKQTELLQLQEMLAKAQQNKAEAERMLAEATQDYDDTEQQLKADVAFFDVTKQGCTAKAGDWVMRKTLRAQEVEGITEALKILTSDEAKALFGKAIKPGVSPTLLQVGSEDAAAPFVKKAYEALKAQASKSHSLLLANLAASVVTAEVGHFTKVLSAIDNMIEQLKTQNDDDLAKKDECQENYKNIDSKVADLNWNVEVNQAAIDKLVALIEKMDKELTETLTNIDAVKQQIVDLKAERQAENAAFLQAKKDDEDAIVLLGQAKDALSKYYKDNAIEMGKLQNFLQGDPEFARSEDDAPEATFSDKGQRKGETKGIVSILTMIMEDLGAEIKEAQKAEEAAQLQFEEALKVAEALQTELEEKKTNLEGAVAARKTDKTDEEAKMATNNQDILGQETTRTDIKPDCDFIISKFASRSEKRSAEMDGLRQAKEFLAGYQASASLVQAPKRSLRPVRKVVL